MTKGSWTLKAALKLTTSALCATAIASSALGQVTLYSNNPSAPYYTNFNVGQDGTVYFGNQDQTTVNTPIGPSQIDFGVFGISSDGSLLGGYRTAEGLYQSGFIGSDGSLTPISFGPSDVALKAKEGDYSIFGSIGTSGTLYQGTTEIGSFSSIRGLNAQGQLLYGNTLRMGDGSVRDLTIPSSEQSLGGRAQNLNNLGKVLLTSTDRAPGGFGYPYAENFTFSFQTYDAATGDLFSLPAMPYVYSDSLVFDSMNKSVLASMNDAGDVVAAVRTTNVGEVDSSVIWHFSQNTGWTNLTDLYSADAFDYLTSINISNGGIIYGTFNGPYDPNAFSTSSTGFTMTAPVPEPASMILLAAGAGGLMAARRRKKQA